MSTLTPSFSRNADSSAYIEMTPIEPTSPLGVTTSSLAAAPIHRAAEAIIPLAIATIWVLPASRTARTASAASGVPVTVPPGLVTLSKTLLTLGLASSCAIIRAKLSSDVPP